MLRLTVHESFSPVAATAYVHGTVLSSKLATFSLIVGLPGRRVE
jgi:hypothetical protein